MFGLTQKTLIAYGVFVVVLVGFYFWGNTAWTAVFPDENTRPIRIEITNEPKDALFVGDQFIPEATCYASNKKEIPCSSILYELEDQPSEDLVAFESRKGAVRSRRVGSYTLNATVVGNEKATTQVELTFRPHPVTLSCASTGQGLRVTWTPILASEIGTFDALGLWVYQDEVINTVYDSEPFDKFQDATLIPLSDIKSGVAYTVTLQSRAAIDKDTTYLYVIGKSECTYSQGGRSESR